MEYRIIEVPNTLPFCPTNEQALYVEKEYDLAVNMFICDHHDDIVGYFHEKKLDFCYMPLHFADREAELFLYHNPCANTDNLPVVQISTQDLVSALFGENVPDDLKPSIIIYQKYQSTQETARFMAIEMNLEKMEGVFSPMPELSAKVEKKSFWRRLFGHETPSYLFHKDNYFESIASQLGSVLRDPNETGFYSSVNWYDEKYFDYLKENGSLLAEIDLKIHQLENRGVDSLFLKKMLCKMVDDTRQLSRLVVTEDYRIMLPDYNDMEIKMEPVNKAVYLLFLRHEEGIRLKEMSDYKEELAEIYSKLSNDSDEKQKATIDALVNPMSNSINEKISRIRQAFVARMDEELAQNYFISGNKGENKVVLFPRKQLSNPSNNHFK